MSSAPEPAGGAARAFALGAALLIGVNLRPAITSVSALLDQATSAFALDDVQRSLLATLPVIAFGVTAPLGPALARRIGTARALVVAMSALATTLVLRVLADWMLLPGTFLAGAAIMIAATLLPPYLKSLNAGGLWVGLSTMSFGLGAALGASLAVPSDAMLGGVTPALGAWAVPAALAAVAVGAAGRRTPVGVIGRPRLAIGPAVRPTVLLMTAVFSLQALLYFAVTSWLPLMLASRGEDRGTAGWLLGWFSLVGLLPSLLAPVIARRRRALTWFGPGLGIVMAAGFAWFALDGSDAAVVTILGISQSAGFGLSMGLLVSLSADEASAGILSAISQGVGYAVAGAGSILLGAIRDTTGTWTVSLLAMAVIALLFSAAVALVIRRRPVTLISA